MSKRGHGSELAHTILTSHITNHKVRPRLCHLPWLAIMGNGIADRLKTVLVWWMARNYGQVSSPSPDGERGSSSRRSGH